ncbi:MAG: ParB/RepB/Spo0J family partition protein [Perlucidibaca sp.]
MSTAKKRGLGGGRGLDALLGTVRKVQEEVTAAASGQTPSGELRQLPVEWLERGRYQPRKEMDPQALQELADSIKAQGILQPIVVRALSAQRYEIIAGERRWRAAQLAQLESVPALIRDFSDEAAIALALIENIQREDLNPLEEAVAMQRFADEFSLTHQQVADAVGKSRVAVTNLMRLLALHDEVKRSLEHGDLDMGHARALLALPAGQQVAASRQVVDKGLSVRQTEALVRQLRAEKPEGAAARAVDPNVRKLQERLSEKLGAAVQIDCNAKGKGRLVISYNTLDELDGILAHIH